MISSRSADLPMLGNLPSIVILTCLVLAPTLVVGEVQIADPGTRLVDKANVGGVQAAKIELFLKALQEQVGPQVKVLTLPSLDGEDIVTFSQRHYELWKLGQKGKNDGALVVLAVQDRKIRIHTGYGLEGALPDSWCGSECRDIAKTYFKAGKYGDGLLDLVQRIATRLAQDRGVAWTPPEKFVAQQPPAGPEPDYLFFYFILFVIVIQIIVSYFRRRGRRVYQPGRGWYYLPSANSWDTGGSWGGSWTSGGGSSGGGSFGGGGSSGGGGGGASW